MTMTQGEIFDLLEEAIRADETRQKEIYHELSQAVISDSRGTGIGIMLQQAWKAWLNETATRYFHFGDFVRACGNRKGKDPICYEPIEAEVAAKMRML